MSFQIQVTEIDDLEYFRKKTLERLENYSDQNSGNNLYGSTGRDDSEGLNFRKSTRRGDKWEGNSKKINRKDRVYLESNTKMIDGDDFRNIPKNAKSINLRLQ